MEAEAEARDERGKRRGSVRADRDTIVIELPKIDPKLRNFLLEMIPGRALFKVLCNPPEDVITHTRNARREQLLAIRSLIDGMLDEGQSAKPRGRAREVNIE